MKKILLLVLFLIISGSNVAQAQQNEIAPEKKKVIAEIISVIKADQRVEETMSAMLKQMQAAYPSIIKNTLAGLDSLNDRQRSLLEAEIVKRNQQFSVKFNERLRQKINFREFTEQTIYPLYDKFFTEADLKELLAFYKTPLGQKMNKIMPQMATESIRLSQELLIPKITSIVNEIVQEEIRDVQKTSIN